MEVREWEFGGGNLGVGVWGQEFWGLKFRYGSSGQEFGDGVRGWQSGALQFLSTARWIYKRLFFVGYFIKYGQYRSIKVNHSQLRLIKVD